MKLFLFIVTLLLVSCSSENVEKRYTNYKLSGGSNPLQIVIIDSCEYLYGPWGYSSVLTHKGNCKNPTHGK